MTPSISKDAFNTLISNTGLPLSQAQKDALYEPYALVEAMLALVNKPMPVEAEPALIFHPEPR